MTITLEIPDGVALQLATASGMPQGGVAKDFLISNLRTKITNQVHVNLRKAINDDVTVATAAIMDQIVIS